MTVDVDIEIEPGPMQGIPVPVTAVDVTPLQGPAVLRGWSLRDASGDTSAAVEGTVTSPAAGATIATTAALAAGTYDVNWTVGLAGAAAAAELNNFMLADTAGNVLQSLNPGAAGTYPQVPARVTVAQGNAVFVKAIALGTVGVTYEAQLELVPTLAGSTTVELQDGNQPLGEIALQAGASSTEELGEHGLQVNQQLKLHVISGAVVGALYVNNIH